MTRTPWWAPLTTAVLTPASRATLALALATCTLTGCPDADPPAAPQDAMTGDLGTDDAPGDAPSPADAQVDGSDSAADPCAPNPCAATHRVCDGGLCGDCIPGWNDIGGTCLDADPCDPDPCATVGKACTGGICGSCLPGFLEQPDGSCQAPNACAPNPCLEPFRTVCALTQQGIPICLCDAGTHEDGAGGCTFEPCTPNPCPEPFSACAHTGPVLQCGCPQGSLQTLDAETGDQTCVPDPCWPNPCTAYGTTACTLNTDDPGADGVGVAVCGCTPGWEDLGAGCVEAAAPSPVTIPGPDPALDAVTIADGRQLFVDDYLIATRTGLSRRLHAAFRPDAGWAVTPDPAPEDGTLGRARAGGSLVHVPTAELDALPADHPLAALPWRLYYFGYRQPFVAGPQIAWLCVAAAAQPQGPWVKPDLYPVDPADPAAPAPEAPPAPHCVLRVDGLVQGDVTLHDGAWRLTAMRQAVGDTPAGGLYVYGSGDGVTWNALTPDGPVLGTADTATPPALYPRIGERSRLVWDPWAARWTGLLSLPSATVGDARGVVFGSPDPLAPGAGLALHPDPISAPAVLGPDLAELSQSRVYGDLAAWRVDGLWLALLHKRQDVCPRIGYAGLASSRDGVHWQRVRDEVDVNLDGVLLPADSLGEPDSHVDSLTGGAPAEADGMWHFFFGGTEAGPCAETPAAGGIVRAVTRAGGLAGLEAGLAGSAVLQTAPLRLRDGLQGAELRVDAWVSGKLTVRLEAISAIDTVLGAAEAVLTAGDHRDEALSLPPLHDLTADRFRIRFTLTGGGELFGFRVADPACAPNPCTDPERAVCDSRSGEAVCRCSPPLHDDGLGEGGCTDDPCTPDPCGKPHQLGCEAVDGAPVCGCEAGWVPAGAGGLCMPDPCEPLDAEPACLPPGPSQCRVVAGEPECYCPEGSAPGATGCHPTDALAFVTSLAVAPVDLGGLGGGDALCAQLANAAGLDGTWAAWLSTPDQPASARFAGGGPWRTWDPVEGLWSKLVAKDLGDLTDGTLGTALQFTELGGVAPGPCLVWTGTTAAGQPSADAATAASCGAWSSADGLGLAGRCDDAGSAWTAMGPAGCGQALRLYCLERP